MERNQNPNPNDDIKHMPAPCKECMFRKDITPGETGGSPVELYIAQMVRPYLIPCHKACDFDDPEWREKSMDVSQCAGAAMFRRANGLDVYLPKSLHALDPTDDVFTDPIELVKHHRPELAAWLDSVDRQVAIEAIGLMGDMALAHQSACRPPIVRAIPKEES